MTNKKLKRQNRLRDNNVSLIKTIDEKIIEIKKWITDYNIAYIDLLAKQNQTKIFQFLIDLCQ